MVVAGAGLGFSLNPVKIVKSVAKGAAKGAKVVGTTAIQAQGVVFKSMAAVGKLPGVKTTLNTVVPGSGALVPLSNRAYDYAGNKMIGVGADRLKLRAAGQVVGTAGQYASRLPGADGGGGGGGGGAPAAPDAINQLAPAPAAAAPTVKLPGIGPVQRSHAIIGGAVLGGLVLVLLLRK